MKTFFLFSLTFALHATMHAQWEKLPLYGGHAEKLVQSKFNPNDIFAITERNGVWHSSDGGENWKSINGDNEELVGMGIVDLEVAIDKSIIIVAGKKLFRSVDWGKTWIEQKNPYENTLISSEPHFESTLDGTLFIIVYDIGSYNCLLRSTDIGMTWQKVPLPASRIDMFDSFFVDRSNSKILIITGSFGYLYSSTNGGEFWSKVLGINPNYRIYPPSIIYQTDQHVVYGAWMRPEGNPYNNEFYKSVDTGKTWKKKIQEDYIFGIMNDKVYTDYNGMLFTSGGEVMLSSLDSGYTWNRIEESLEIQDFLLKGDTLIGSFPLIGMMSSYNEGKTWKRAKSMTNFTALEGIEFRALSKDTLFAIARDGFHRFSNEIRYSIDGGRTWSVLYASHLLKALRVTNGVVPRYYAIENDTVLIGGTMHQTIPDTLLKWTSYYNPALIRQYEDLQVSTFELGLVYLHAFTTEGRFLFVSKDEGKSWIRKATPPYPMSSFFIQPSLLRPGYVIGYSSPQLSTQTAGMGIWVSSNYGDTWFMTKNDIDPSYTLFGNDFLFHFYPTDFMVSSDYGRTWIKIDDGIEDQYKKALFIYHVSKHRLYLMREDIWYRFENNRWKEILDNNGKRITKGKPEAFECIDNALYAVFPFLGFYRLMNSSITSISDHPTSLQHVIVKEFYPNPFHDIVTLRLSNPHGGVQLRIYDALGRQILHRAIAESISGDTVITWDGKDEKRRLVTPGLYHVLVSSMKIRQSFNLVFTR